MKDLLSILQDFHKQKILVIGDIMLDHYLEGRVKRISPEASIPIISVEKEWFAPGGAGNTVVNIRSLGGKAVLIGETGIGGDGQRLREELLWDIEQQLFGGQNTVVKFRILHENKHVLRADKDGPCKYSSPEFSKKLMDCVEERIKDCDAVLVSDYAKGLIAEDFARWLVYISELHKKILIVDTKPKHFYWFKNCYCIKPNKIEAEKFTGIEINDLKDAERTGLKIKKELQTNVLLTLGNLGMMLFEEESTTHFSSNAKNVFDVTGAGDTVLATFGLALASGAKIQQAVDLANHAAAIVIAKSGTATVSFEELKDSIS